MTTESSTLTELSRFGFLRVYHLNFLIWSSRNSSYIWRTSFHELHSYLVLKKFLSRMICIFPYIHSPFGLLAVRTQSQNPLIWKLRLLCLASCYLRPCEKPEILRMKRLVLSDFKCVYIVSILDKRKRLLLKPRGVARHQLGRIAYCKLSPLHAKPFREESLTLN